jgi:hypothetical protein
MRVKSTLTGQKGLVIELSLVAFRHCGGDAAGGYCVVMQATASRGENS